MSTVLTPQTVEPPDSRSSVLEKIPADARARIDRAVVEFNPPRYRDIYRKYQVAGHGVSFAAFYSYARRLRRAAAERRLSELMKDDAPGLGDFSERLPAFIAQKIVEQLAFDDDVTPMALQRLVNCYRTSLDTVARGRKIAAEAERAAIEERKRHTPSAPWGRKQDGTPYNHIEFLETLHEAVADIYGVNMKTGEEVFRPTRENPRPPGEKDKTNADGHRAEVEALRDVPPENHSLANDPAFEALKPGKPQP